MSYSIAHLFDACCTYICAKYEYETYLLTIPYKTSIALGSAASIPLTIKYHLCKVTLLINVPHHYGYCKFCKSYIVYLYIISYDRIS